MSWVGGVGGQVRLLLSGSRDWDDPRPIHYLLHTAYHKAMTEFDGKLIVIHGGARGADQLAEKWVLTHIRTEWNVDSEVYPVTSEDWRVKGKSAGYQRNQKMVDLGADLGVAFIKAGSKGASMCLELMRNAGIPTFGMDWGMRHGFWPQISCAMCEVRTHVA